MAIDQWLLEQHQAGIYPPVLRFYTWASPTISLGYHQHRWDSAWQQLTWQGTPVELVRRPTGGRAVLHQGDLTYMVITSGLTGKRLDAYQKMCGFLIQGWRSLGVDLHYGSAGRDYIRNPNCFGIATGADLVTANGYKLIGSAQLRRGDAILQHGSMRLEPDTQLFEQVFGETLSYVNLPIIQEGDALIQTVVEVLTNAAADCFGVELVEQPLSNEEWQRILRQSSLELGSPVGDFGKGTRGRGS
ncbi:lipoate--protein ligase family protein [Coleofasciculus sp. LEGE 07092]|nr:biotin/lipoate A/B protein ligase family protein [Coleofasciculus sp. LEGE 07081]MBE9129436.1 lipoate--protein ligase family protein [Coleofasciculus sp. LEGE 07081]MBE9148702.1 lipoate--protein ligase family protein [Coleofasciculus sp. LEGE 07092]